MLKKALSVVLLSSMLLGTVAPAVSYAQEDKLEIVQGAEETEKLGIDEAEVYKRQIKSIQNEVNSIQVKREDEQEMVDKFNETSLEISDKIDQTAVGMGVADIYDLSSIPQRLLLLGRMGRAIRFATTQLRYKVDAAHAEIAEYIFGGFVIAASPFHTVEDMKVYMAQFEALSQKLLSYPDAGLNDTANIYVRSDLDHKLAKARSLKFHELKNMSGAVIDKLNAEIHEITLMRLRPQATVAEIYQLGDRLDQAVFEALNSEDYRASKTEIEALKEAMNKAIRARRHGDKRAEVGKAIDRAKQELAKIRPSSVIAAQLVQQFQTYYE